MKSLNKHIQEDFENTKKSKELAKKGIEQAMKRFPKTMEKLKNS